MHYYSIQQSFHIEIVYFDGAASFGTNWIIELIVHDRDILTKCNSAVKMTLVIKVVYEVRSWNMSSRWYSLTNLHEPYNRIIPILTQRHMLTMMKWVFELWLFVLSFPRKMAHHRFMCTYVEHSTTLLNPTRHNINENENNAASQRHPKTILYARKCLTKLQKNYIFRVSSSLPFAALCAAAFHRKHQKLYSFFLSRHKSSACQLNESKN